MTDVSTTCAVVIFRVKVSCTTSVAIAIAIAIAIVGQSRAKVSGGFTNVSSLAAAAFDLTCILLPVFPPVCLCP